MFLFESAKFSRNRSIFNLRVEPHNNFQFQIERFREMWAAFCFAVLAVCLFDLYHNSRNGAFLKDVTPFLVQMKSANGQISKPKRGHHLPESL
jgi:hypothetical protein